MNRTPRRLACTVALVAIAGLAAAADKGQRLAVKDAVPAGTRALLDTYPGAHSLLQDGRVVCVYGMPMSGGPTPDIAAARFLHHHADAFDVPGLDLVLDAVDDVDHGRFKVYAFKQYVDGLPVEFGFGRVLVLTNTPGEPAESTSRVVFASGRLARPEGFAPLAVDAVAAQNVVKATQEYGRLTDWSEPELVVYYGEGDFDRWITPLRAWKFVGETPLMHWSGMGHRKYTFFVDAASGELVFARNEVLHVDVSGTTRGWATPGTAADHSGNPPAILPIGGLRVGIAGGNTAVSSKVNGAFTITHPGSSQVTVNTSFAQSQNNPWIYINNTNGTGSPLALSANVTPPGPVTFTYNESPTEFFTAQVNVMKHTTEAHDYIKDRAPTFTALDAPIAGNVNSTSTCNAFYNGTSINFYRRGGNCNNTAFSSVVAHEYGHHMVNRRGLAQGAFGEGFSDTVSMMLYNDPIIGRFFTTSGGFVRDPNTANVQYPCPQTAVHFCGQILGGVWWKIRTNFVSKYPSDGFARAQQLHVDWYLITAGGQSANSAHPQTAIEVLTRDDNDGNLNNGTPNYPQICAAFAAHSISCPSAQAIVFAYPNGRPATFVGNQVNNIRVDVLPMGGTPQPGTGTVSYRVNSNGAFTTIPMSQGAPNEYTANFPAMPCGATVHYYFAANPTSGGTVRDPVNAPTSFFTATVVCNCPADWNRDGQVDFFDYLDFVADFNSGNADFNRDGQTDFFDYLDFVVAYDAGC